MAEPPKYDGSNYKSWIIDYQAEFSMGPVRKILWEALGKDV
jgi:hypothetical protein